MEELKQFLWRSSGEEMDNNSEIKRVISFIMRTKGRFPTLIEMCDALSYNSEQTFKYMEALEEDGYLEKIGSWYKLPKKGEIEKIKEKVDKIDGFIENNSFKVLDLPEGEPGILSEIVEPEDIPSIEKTNPVPVENIKMDLKEHTDNPIPIEIKEKKFYKPDPVRKTVDIKTLRKKINTVLKIKQGLKGFMKSKKIPISLRFQANTSGKKIETVEKKKKNKKLEERMALYGMPVYIIQVLMGIIGSGAAVISIYYTSIWLIEFLPFGLALLLSSIMVGFSVSAFEAIILFLSGQVTKSRISKMSIVSGMAVLWIIVTFFSIMSTVAGQYNKHVSNLKVEAKSGVSTGKIRWSLLKERKHDIRKRLSEYRQQTSVLNKIISGMDDVESRLKNSGLWYESQYKLRKANKQISALSKKMGVVRKEERALLKESRKEGILLSNSKKDIPNFYGWLAKILGVAEDKVQFIMSLFPAIFVDLIAPVGIAMSLFLRNKYRRKK